MAECPHLSSKALVLIKKALEEEICGHNADLDELIQAYHLPRRKSKVRSLGTRTDVQSYYQSAVLDLTDPTQSQNAAIIFVALVADLRSDSPVIDRTMQWMDYGGMVQEVYPPHVKSCLAQLRLEKVELEVLTEFAIPIITGKQQWAYPETFQGASSSPVKATNGIKAIQALSHMSRRIFIIHGHDELNVRRLAEFLRDILKQEPVVMSLQPGKGRTLIEKFEQTADGASFAFALITPDDIVQTATGSYAQARPNVVFELGWFYGKLGRHNVCLLFKEGTRIHSDLDGISRVVFKDNVTDKAIEIEKEIREAGIDVR